MPDDRTICVSWCIRGRLLRADRSSGEAWAMAMNGVMPKVINNPKLRRHGFVMASNLAVQA